MFDVDACCLLDFSIQVTSEKVFARRKIRQTRTAGHVVASLDKTLYDNYLCLVASNKQQIYVGRSQKRRPESLENGQLLSGCGFAGLSMGMGFPWESHGMGWYGTARIAFPVGPMGHKIFTLKNRFSFVLSLCERKWCRNSMDLKIQQVVLVVSIWILWPIKG